MSRTLLIAAGTVAALMLLLPPWQDNTGRSKGYAPLFNPPVYRAVLSRPPRPPAATNGQFDFSGIADAILPTEDRKAELAWGRLLTQWLILGVLVGAAVLITNRPGRKPA